MTLCGVCDPHAQFEEEHKSWLPLAVRSTLEDLAGVFEGEVTLAVDPRRLVVEDVTLTAASLSVELFAID